MVESKNKFLKFSEGWISKNDVKPIHKEKTYSKKYIYLKTPNINVEVNLLKD